MKRLHVWILSLILTAIAVSLFLYKLFALGFPISADKVSFIWDIEAHVSFTASEKPVKVTLQLPRSTVGTAVMDENFISRGYGLTVVTEGTQRMAVWSIAKATGTQSVYYRATVRKVPTLELNITSKPPEPLASTLEGAELLAAEALLAEIREKADDDVSLIRELLKQVNRGERSENVGLLIGQHPTDARKLEVAARILEVGGINARVVHGIELQDYEGNAPISHWLEIYNADEKRWKPFDPKSRKLVIPDEYLPWWRGAVQLADAKGVSMLATSVSVSRNQELAVSSAVEGGKISHPLLLDFSMFSLPLETQTVYRVILLIPIGALILVFLRNVVGFNTFGTFMPVLVALAFRETQLLWGIIFFILIVGIGLGIRFYFEHLKLLMVPRLGSVLTTVVLCMAMLSVIAHKLGIEHGLSIALFPMVIMTMVIERMSLVWEEQGAVQALKQGFGSLFCAILVYWVITAERVQHIFFVFPELLLIVLAITLILGRYTGYRLVELYRFRALARLES